MGPSGSSRQRTEPAWAAKLPGRSHSVPMGPHGGLTLHIVREASEPAEPSRGDGSLYEYSYNKCRCAARRAANARAHRRLIDRYKQEAPRGRHGTTYCYDTGCRCTSCRAAKAQRSASPRDGADREEPSRWTPDLHCTPDVQHEDLADSRQRGAEVPSWATSPAVRRSMQGNKGWDSSPEMAVRRAVHAIGLRYRVGTRPLPELNRRADLVFRRAAVAVLVDGCYWHGCPAHFVQPKSNVSYWTGKIGRNISRDRETDERLSEAGWAVVRVWEHDDVSEAVLLVARVVRTRLAGRRSH